jgi:subtilisin-like proprotein convertase family protein
MKKLFTFIAMALCAATGAFAQTVFSTNINVNTAIQDNDPNGLASAFSLSGFGGTVTNVSVSLNLTGGYNGDLFAYLTGPGGFAVLLNRVGVTGANPNGYGDTGLNVTFLSGGADFHSYGAGNFTANGAGQVTGTWGVDGRNISPFSAGSAFDNAGRTALLESFNGSNPNGTWGLFIGDYSPGDISMLVSYNVSFTAVPEPGMMALLALGCAAALARRRK